MRVILLIAVLMANGFSQTTSSSVKKGQEQHKKENEPSNEISKSTTGPIAPVTSPVGQPPQNSQASDAKDKAGGWPHFGDIFWPSWALVLVTVFAVRAALKTLKSINAQVAEMRKTGEQTDKLINESISQSKSMERSTNEATRLASAMEVVAKEIAVSAKAATDSVATLKERTAQQMRAYLAVVVGSAIYQERSKGLKFEGKPLLINTGHTPANNVRYGASAAILPIPLPDDFVFPLADEVKGAAMLGPQQNGQLSGIVKDFCDDADVDHIKICKEKALYVWGIVTYEDIFGESHYTRFCQSLTWLGDGKVIGYYVPGHNNAT